MQSCPIGELSLRIGLAVAAQDLAALRSVLADAHNQCDDASSKTALSRAIALMSSRQQQWFYSAVIQIQQGA